MLSEYDAWEHVCADALEKENGFVCLVAAYLDAAYNHTQGRTADDPRVHTVAAYLAYKDDWRKLRKEWRKALEVFSVPFFHLKDFEQARNVVKFGKGQISSKSPYKEWSIEKFDAFEKQLHSVINRRRKDGTPRINSFTSNVMVDEYERTLPDDLRDHPRCRSYFIINVANAMEGVAAWANSRIYYEPIHYIFAGGDHETGNLDSWFSHCFKYESTTHHFRLGKGFTRIGYDLQWMKSEPALQMVDCPAYELNKWVVEWSKRGFTPMRKDEWRQSMSSLCRIDHFGAALREPELIETYEAVRANDKRLKTEEG